MFDRVYRQRLEADLARWETDGVITPAAVAAIRVALPPLAPGINIAVVVAIVGGLLIAAAFLAFVAAHWTEIARLPRLAMLFAGILSAHGLGAWFARAGHPVLADLCAAVGSIIFGAAIALVGQMYHLGGDFAGGMLLWAVGALATAALTGSRGALAVALAAASIWSWMRVFETDVPHFAFVAFWLLAGGLALAWNSRVAAHLVAVAALPWWIASVVSAPSSISGRRSCSPMAQRCCSAAESRLPLHPGRARLAPGPSCRPTALFRWRASRSWRRPWPTRPSAATHRARKPAALDDLMRRRGRDLRLCRHRHDAPGRHGLRRNCDRARPCRGGPMDATAIG